MRTRSTFRGVESACGGFCVSGRDKSADVLLVVGMLGSAALSVMIDLPAMRGSARKRPYGALTCPGDLGIETARFDVIIGSNRKRRVPAEKIAALMCQTQFARMVSSGRNPENV